MNYSVRPLEGAIVKASTIDYIPDFHHFHGEAQWKHHSQVNESSMEFWILRIEFL